MIDANLPGITVQPMELLGTGGEGGTDPVQKNTVFFDDVRVPAFTPDRRREQRLEGRPAPTSSWSTAAAAASAATACGSGCWRYCQETKRDGMPLTEDAGRARPAGRHLHQDRGPAAVRPAQLLADLRQAAALLRRARSSRYYRKMTGLWMTGAILEAVGPAALTRMQRGARRRASWSCSSATASSPCTPAAPPTSSASAWRAASASAATREREGGRHGARGEAMDLSLTESQQMLRASARDFVEREAPTHALVALQSEESSLVPELWRKAVGARLARHADPGRVRRQREHAAPTPRCSSRSSDAAPLPGPVLQLGRARRADGARGRQRGAAQARSCPPWPAARRCCAVAITEPSTSWGPQGDDAAAAARRRPLPAGRHQALRAATPPRPRT